MFRFKAFVLTRDSFGRCEGSSWPFMLSFRDGRCDAKDGIATDRQSLLPSELDSQGGTRGSLGNGNVTLRVGVVEEVYLVPRQEESLFLSHESNGLRDPPWRLVAAGP